MTVLPPEARFAQHKSGTKSNKYVREYGVELIARECVSGLTYDEAQKEEVRQANVLRARGWAAWQK